MTCQDSRKLVKFSPEDRARITRLQEEIIGRMEEIARIHVRNLEILPQFPVQQMIFSPARGGTANAPEPVGANLEITYSDGSKSCCSNPPGACCTGPCPC